MKLRIFSSIFLFALTTLAFASHAPIQPIPVIAPAKLYVSVFGGAGYSNNFNAKQFGTAFITEAQGGPLSVNAFGQLNDRSTSFLGAQLGYQAQERVLNFFLPLTVAPAVELEAYATDKSTFNGTLTNNVLRLPEHDFAVSYPMRRTMFLANAVLNINNTCFLVHPYIGVGIGNAIVRISNAISSQLNPPESINHYNANQGDTNSTFAGQIKLGLSYDINKCISIFAEYRSLYLASTHFVFGSAISPDHVETSSWQVKFDSQRYNLGNVGVRFNW